MLDLRVSGLLMKLLLSPYLNVTGMISEQPLPLGTSKAPGVGSYPSAITRPGPVALPLTTCGFLLDMSHIKFFPISIF